MVQLNSFDASQVEPNVGFDPIPAGRYIAAITASEMKPTKAGNGEYLNLEFSVLDGPYKGRKLWAKLNLKNPSAQAVQIGRGQLSAICRAVGVMRPADTCELHNLPLQITVKLKTRSDTGELVNEVTGFAKREAAVGLPQQQDQSSAPWRR